MNNISAIKTQTDNFELPSLNFTYQDLEPWISAQNTEYHYTLHHKSYTEQLNILLKKYNSIFKNKNIYDILTFLRSTEIKEYVVNDSIFNDEMRKLNFVAGGYLNHCYYWNSMIKVENELNISTNFLEIINNNFISLNNFISNFIKAFLDLQGSGYVWLVYNVNKDNIFIETTINQNFTFNIEKNIPLMCCDGWEHSYYLTYLNDKKKFINGFFNLINWQNIEEIYNEIGINNK